MKAETGINPKASIYSVIEDLRKRQSKKGIVSKVSYNTGNSYSGKSYTGNHYSVNEEGIGTEIGLSIDHEPVEGTDVGGVSSPTGGFRDVFQDEDAEEATSDIICPECGSHDVNIHDNGQNFYCVSCGHSWPVNDSDDDGENDHEETSSDIKKHTKNKLKSKEAKKETKNIKAEEKDTKAENSEKEPEKASKKESRLALSV